MSSGVSQVTLSGFTFKKLDGKYDRAGSGSPSPGGVHSSDVGGGHMFGGGGSPYLTDISGRPPRTVFAVDAAVETEGSFGVDMSALLSEQQSLLLQQRLSASRGRDDMTSQQQPQQQNVRHPLLVKAHSEFTPVALSALLRHSAVQQLDRRVQRLDHVEKATEGLSPSVSQQPQPQHYQRTASAGSSSGGMMRRRGGSPNSAAVAAAPAWGSASNRRTAASAAAAARGSSPPASAFMTAAPSSSSFDGAPPSPGSAFRVQPASAPRRAADDSTAASSRVLFGSGGRGGAQPPPPLPPPDDDDVPEAALRFHQLREEYMSIRRMFRDSHTARSVSMHGGKAAAANDSDRDDGVDGTAPTPAANAARQEEPLPRRPVAADARAGAPQPSPVGAAAWGGARAAATTTAADERGSKTNVASPETAAAVANDSSESPKRTKSGGWWNRKKS